MKTKLGMLSLCVLLATPAFAANEWDIDTKHSSASFAIRHMMVSNVRGQMSGITGVVNYDGENVDTLKVSASLDPATINTNDTNRDEHLRSAEFFDVAQYPKITFESTGVIPLLEEGFKLGGKLTMHGVTKSVELTVDGPTEPIKDTQGNIKIGAAATTTINRKDFGISYNNLLESGGVLVGDEVAITLELELIKRQNNPKKTNSK